MSAARRAPAGGCEVGGVEYDGGQFLPDEFNRAEDRSRVQPERAERLDPWITTEAPDYCDVLVPLLPPHRGGRVVATGQPIGDWERDNACARAPGSPDYPWWPDRSGCTVERARVRGGCCARA